LRSFSELKKSFEFMNFQPGCLRADRFVVMASPFFRRSFSGQNNFAPDFIAKFWAVEDSEIDAYIAVDENRVRLSVKDRFYMERDAWYGAKFNGNIAEIRLGMAKFTPPPDILESVQGFAFANAFALNVKWSESNGIKTFQALELKSARVTHEINGVKFHPARYLHAEFDLQKNTFRHFDGAIQFFTDEEYRLRCNSDFNHDFKNRTAIKARSTKLFKFNGSFDVTFWTEFCCQFFHANPLIHEYFTSKYPDYVVRILDRMQESASQQHT
jgi:hypothetical protein